jgi:drug/metabolite transporter (DMT)-like permease
MHYAVATIPPMLMAGVRFTTAGVLLYSFARMRGAAPPAASHWRGGAIVGSLLMGGNACVAIAVQRIPTGVAALLVAMTAIFIVLIDWARPHGRRPSLGVSLGLFVGLVGVGILVDPGHVVSGDSIDPIGAGVVLFGSLLWSAGSIYSRHAVRPASALIGTSLHMFAGGLFVLGLSLVSGEAFTFDAGALSGTSVAAFLYLLTFGSLLGFTAYIYLLGVSTPARVSTYAYVNPVVAVLLGWAFAGEQISTRILIASAVIIGAVALITTAGGSGSPRRRDQRPEDEGADTCPVTIVDAA